MAYFIPNSIQKRLLRYALSRLGLLDTDEYKLENLDISLGRTNNVELHNVGLKADKLEAILKLPPAIRLELAKVLLLRITIRADLWNPSIAVEIQGVRITLRLDKAPQQHVAADKKKRRRSSAGVSDAIPTTEDIAKSFLAEEPSEEKRELEDAFVSQSRKLHDSDVLSDDGSNGGMGVAMALPSFLANYLQGVQDRLQISISDVDLEVKGEIDSTEDVFASAKSSEVTVRMHCDTLSLDGVTSDEGQADDGVESRPGKRHITLRQLTVDLISDASCFANLSQTPSVASRSPSQPKSPNLARSDGSRSDSHASAASPTSGQSSRRRDRSNSLGQSETGLFGLSPRSQRRGSLEALLRQRTAMSDSERFADARDDGLPNDSMYSSLDASSVAHSTFENNRLQKPQADEDDLDRSTFFDLPVDGDAFVNDRDAGSERPSEQMPSRKRLSTTLPDVRVLEPGKKTASGHNVPPTSQSQPTPGRAISQSPEYKPRWDSLTPDRSSTPNRSSSPGSIGSHSSNASSTGLAESKLFTHEDAESMYMSALSEAPLEASHGMPGGWEKPADTSQSHHVAQDALPQQPDEPLQSLEDDEEGATPRAGSPTLPNELPSPHTTAAPLREATRGVVPTESQDQAKPLSGYMAKNVVLVTQVDAWVPLQRPDTHGAVPDSPYEDVRLSSMYRPTPGAFSSHDISSSLAQSVASRKAAVSREAESHPPSSTSNASQSPSEISTGQVEVNLDVSVARLLHQLLSQVQNAFKVHGTSDSSGDKDRGDTAHSSLPRFQFVIGHLNLRLLEHLTMHPAERPASTQVPDSSDNSPLFAVDIEHLQTVSLDNSELRTNVRRLALKLGNDPILSFDSSTKLNDSIESPPRDDIQLSYRASATGTEVVVNTLPIQLNVDVQRIDGTLSCFGGLSGVLELSSSISSASPTIASPVRTTPHRSRGVRFAGEPEPQTTSLSGVKLNAHFRGLKVLLTGQSSGLSLETTSIRMVGRERGISTSFKELRLAGPYFDATKAVPPLNLRLEGTRIDFLFTPEESDLTNLVSLITPSRDKYEDDDDVLLDTLLRQRQKGSLIRVNTNALRLEITDLNAAQKLQALGEELAKVQNVAKYFPEDDRPGMLTMLTVKDLKADVSVDNALGTFRLGAHGLRIGHVGLPPLLASSVDRMWLTDGHGLELVTEVVRHEVVDLPMLMVRIISDEMIPTVKVKLHNLCAEYRVPTIVALMGLQNKPPIEDLSASIATSIATVTRHTSNLGLRRTSTGSSDGSPSQTSKSMHVEVLFRDCAVGLNPRALPSKALFVLSDARFYSQVPTDTTYSASIDLSKASLLVIDNLVDSADLSDTITRPTVSAMGSRNVLELCQSGYVSVATISKAHFSFRSWEDVSSTRITEVTAKNELFVMESCADSTQTLISLAGALGPPLQPNKVELYRTKVVPMEDMMASFTGRPIVDNQTSADLDEDSNDDDFDIPVDMIGSFYGPDDATDDDFMAEVINDMPQSDELVKLKNARTADDGERATLNEFGERCRISPVAHIFEYDEGYYSSHAGTKPMARIWNSTKNEYGIASHAKIEQSQLRVHLQDVHFIWNLFDGYDWARTRETIEKAVYDVETKAEERRRGKRHSSDQESDNEEVIGDFLFNSIWIEVPANKDPRELARNINRDVDDLASETGSYATTTTHTNATQRSPASRTRRKRLRLQRSRHRKITFELRGVSADLHTFPPDSGETQTSLDVRIRDLEVFDHVPSSTWKKFATYMKDAGERELDKPMIRLELLDVKPVEGLAASEAVLRVSVLPLRLHVDQDALDFITRFFEFKDDKAPSSAPAGPAPFIQRIEVNTVFVKLDYKPKKVDYAGIRSGHTTEFMNFFILDDCDIVLRHCIIYGVSGFDKLHKTLNDIWMPDVKRNQLPTVLAGLAPVRPIVNVTSGVRDLVYIPLREYNKDGRIVRSVQKGAVAFARTTTSELARLGAKLAIGTQNVLQGAEDLLSPPPSGASRRQNEADWDDTTYPLHTSPGHAPDESEEQRATSNYADQPIGVLAGLRSAARSLERDLLTARDAIVAIPGEVMESESASGAVGVVARRAPTVILRTARGASKAVGVALLGAGNALDPESRRKVEEKYKRY